MKIAFIVIRFPLLSETFILNQIVGLIERGHEVDIYAYKAGDTSKMHPDVEKYHLLSRTYYVVAPKIAANYFLRALKGLVKLLGKKQYDIIHCQFGELGLYAARLRNFGFLKGKLVTSFRGHDISRYIQEYGSDVYKQLFDAGDFFLTNCEYFKHRLLKLGCDENKVVVHRSGLDCSRFAFTPRSMQPNDRVRIASTGRLVEKKGIEYSIRAVAKLTKMNYNIEYNIIGDGPLRENFQQLIQELDVSDAVKLLGWKQQQELVEILNNSHIFIAPSVTAKDGDQDAPVNTLKEAMAMGLPVIGTQHGGIPELIEDGISGFLVPERDADAISQKLSYLIEHPQLWSQIGQSGRAYVEEHYDLHKLNDELVEIYWQLLNTDSNAPQQRSPELLVNHR
jgi:colanic acid/amylovoran biosynthesis glycosyltransferase